MKTILELSDVKAMRGGKEVLSIGRLNFSQGELVSIIGPNGAGKSTFLQVINHLLPVSQGTIRLYGQEAKDLDIRSFRRRCSLVFQEALILKDTVFNNVALPLKLRNQSKKEIEEKVLKALGAFQCAHLADRLAHQLSGGEAQRVCLARALVCEPELLLLDEPFTALDPSTRMELGLELKQIAVKQNMTVLLVSHNLYDVLLFSERTIVMEKGRIIQDDLPETILRRPVNLATAKLIGMDNIFACKMRQTESGTEVGLHNGFSFLHPAVHSRAEKMYCCLPGDIFRTHANEAGVEVVRFDALVTQVTPSIGVYHIKAEAQGLCFNLKMSREKAVAYLRTGETVRLAFDPREAHFICS